MYDSGYMILNRTLILKNGVKKLEYFRGHVPYQGGGCQREEDMSPEKSSFFIDALN